MPFLACAHKFGGFFWAAAIRVGPEAKHASATSNKILVDILMLNDHCVVEM